MGGSGCVDLEQLVVVAGFDILQKVFRALGAPPEVFDFFLRNLLVAKPFSFHCLLKRKGEHHEQSRLDLQVLKVFELRRIFGEAFQDEALQHTVLLGNAIFEKLNDCPLIH